MIYTSAKFWSICFIYLFHVSLCSPSEPTSTWTIWIQPVRNTVYAMLYKIQQSDHRKAVVYCRRLTFSSCTALSVQAAIFFMAPYKIFMHHFLVWYHEIIYMSFEQAINIFFYVLQADQPKAGKSCNSHYKNKLERNRVCCLNLILQVVYFFWNLAFFLTRGIQFLHPFFQSTFSNTDSLCSHSNSPPSDWITPRQVKWRPYGTLFGHVSDSSRAKWTFLCQNWTRRLCCITHQNRPFNHEITFLTDCKAPKHHLLDISLSSSPWWETCNPRNVYL